MSPTRKTHRKTNRKTQRLIGPLRKNDLKQFGYATSLPATKRQSALLRAVSVYGALGVFRKLNAVATLTKNRSPKTSAVFLMDRDWVKRHCM
ncbi:MAG: hypothetical protein EBX41_10150 [Chitinophagia bacterium]|nr:hypothetical protein [Chitinophagia bacterium]